MENKEENKTDVYFDTIAFVVRDKHNNQNMISVATGQCDPVQLVVGKETLITLDVVIPPYAITNPQMRKALGKNNCLNMKVTLRYHYYGAGSISVGMDGFKFDGLDDFGRRVRVKKLMWFVNQIKTEGYTIKACRTNASKRVPRKMFEAKIHNYPTDSSGRSNKRQH